MSCNLPPFSYRPILPHYQEVTDGVRVALLAALVTSRLTPASPRAPSPFRLPHRPSSRRFRNTTRHPETPTENYDAAAPSERPTVTPFPSGAAGPTRLRVMVPCGCSRPVHLKPSLPSNYILRCLRQERIRPQRSRRIHHRHS